MAAYPYPGSRFRPPRFARYFTGSTSQYLTAPSPVASGALTIACWYNLAGATTNPTFVTVGAVGGTAEVYCGVLTSGQHPFLYTQSSSGYLGVSVAASITVGTVHHHAVTVDGAGNGAVFLDGGSKTTGSVYATSGWNQITVGAFNNNAGYQAPMEGALYLPAVWNVALRDAEIKKLAAGAAPWTVRPGNLVFCPLWKTRTGPDINPFGLTPAQRVVKNTGSVGVAPWQQRIRTRAPILYSFASGGGGTLVGTAAATSTATGTLVGAGTLTGTATATSTATGTLAGAGLLTGAAAAASTATGTLSGGAYLTGTAAATSTATGTLAGAGALAGTATATSTATGTLSSGAYLVGTAAATSTATGTLAGAGALTGTAAATSTATATLAGSGALTGTSAATSTATGTLTTATSLVGRADATSTATGTLAGAGRMTGTAAATSTAPAFLIGFGPISGIAAATSTATGTLASRSWVFRAGRIVSIPADIRTAAIPADIRTVQ